MMKKIILSEGGNVSFPHPNGNLVDKKGTPHFKSDNLNVTADSSQPENTDHNNIGYVQNEIHGMMSGLHNEFKNDHGEDLFGKNAEGLGKPGKKNKNTIYSGSTAHLQGASGVDPETFVNSKSGGMGPAKIGDIDTAINPAHGEKLKQTLERLKNQKTKVGNYTVVGHVAKGNEVHALMQHDNGKMHQVDFNKTVGLGTEPNEHALFPTSHSQEDLENGYKGVVHKLLLNSAGLDRYKFSLYGLGDRSIPELPAKASAEEKLAHAQANYVRDPEKVASTMFPSIDKADTKHIKHSEGVAYLMGKHSNGVNFSDMFDGEGGIATQLKSRGFSDETISDHRNRLGQAFNLGKSGKKYSPSARRNNIGESMSSVTSFREWKQLQEVLSKDASAGEWIKDFQDSDNPKFAGKSKEKRRQMALAAFYAKQRNESKESDPCWDGYEMVGMKTKNGKKVPNCVPKQKTESVEEEILSEERSYQDYAKTVANRMGLNNLDSSEELSKNITEKEHSEYAGKPTSLFNSKGELRKFITKMRNKYVSAPNNPKMYVYKNDGE